MLKAVAFGLPAALFFASLPVSTALAQFGGGDPASQFMLADSNKDGVVTRDEYRAQRMKNFGTIDKNGDGFVFLDEMKAVMPNAQAKMMVGMMFGRFDTNGDKKISKAEWAAAPMPMFDRADTNKDNKVTQNEIKALRR
jgi:hypothetical protein